MWQGRNRQGRSEVKSYLQLYGKFKDSPDYTRPSLKYIYIWRRKDNVTGHREMKILETTEEYSDWKEKLMGDFRAKGIGDGL